MSETMMLLCGTAASIGVLHALLAPDHYLPFVAMSRARRWSFRRTMVVTLLCGLGHVAGSVILGVVGITAGIAMFRLESVESARAELAGWLLLGFGIAYLAYGIRRAIRHRPHTHWHSHADGTVHEHRHAHVQDHAHVHASDDGAAASPHKPTESLTPWLLFTIFVFGPCEPLIPILMYPAARGSAVDVALVTAVFAVATLVTMAGAVAAVHLAAGAWIHSPVGRYGHALAGFVLVLCGAAMKAGL